LTVPPSDPSRFRQSLLSRLRLVSIERGIPSQTIQLRLAIERLLARLFAVSDPPWLLKGGYAMDLRFRPNARTTRDLDLTVPPTVDGSGVTDIDVVHELLQSAAAIDLGDHFEYRIGIYRRPLPGAPDGGARLPVEVSIAGQVFSRFHLDVGIGDAADDGAETLVGDDLLSFAGVPPATALVITCPQQFAEKVHAYTFPWTGRENTRVKDLADLVLLIERANMRADDVARCVRRTFDARRTHPVPQTLAAPPARWREEYARMAAAARLEGAHIGSAFAALVEFWKRVQEIG